MRTKMLVLLALPLVLLMVLSTGEYACGSGRKGEGTMRKPVVAGMFYPGLSSQLTTMIESMVDESKRKKAGLKDIPPGRVLALVSPHAGYRYSGPTAALGFEMLSGQKVKRVIVLGVRHRGYPAGLTIEDVDAYKTPLGTVPLDDLAKELMKKPLFATAPDDDHSLEVQLPLLQKQLGDFTLVPIIVGQTSDAKMAEAGALLGKALSDESTIIIASGDFTHYGPRFGYSPFGHPENLPARIRGLDMGAVDEIVALDPESFGAYLNKTGATICGGQTIKLMLYAIRSIPGIKGSLLEYTTSGELTGDWSNSVSYVSLAFFGRAGQGEKRSENEGSKQVMETQQDEYILQDEFTLTDQQKKVLLGIARRTLDSHIRDGKVPEVAVDDPLLNQKCGAFVTLHGGKMGPGNLRGCIGYIEGIKPLVETIRDMAVSASTRDHRFPPVTSSELDTIDIEISVLTPLKRETNPENIVMGKHGVIVRQGYRRQGVFLPQVATETGWDREEFMANLCSHKAGLPPDAWKNQETEIFTFTAIVFGEKEKE